MRRTLLTLALVAVAQAAAAHDNHGNAAAAAPPGAATTTTGTRDPRLYFTDTELVTQDGRKVRFYSEMLKDKVVVVNVMYASCKDACPLITQQLVQVKQNLGEAFGRDVEFVSLTSDPAHDTPAALKRFAREQSAEAAGWTFLTGTKDNVEHILKRLGQYSETVEGHSTLLLVLDVDNKRMRKMVANLPPPAIAEAARTIAAARRAGAAAN